MRNCSVSFVFIVLISVLAAACSTSPTSPSSAAAASASGSASASSTAAQLTGTWLIASIQPAGAARQERPFSATYTLTFNDGRLSTRVDCNQCSGSFSVSGNTLTAGPNLACTRAACPTMAFEAAYTALLSGESTTVVTNSTLTLSSARGTIWLVRQD